MPRSRVRPAEVRKFLNLMTTPLWKELSLYRETLSLPMSRVPQTLLSLPPEVRDFSTTIVTKVNPAASLTFLVDTGLSRLNYRIEPIDCFSLILVQSLFDLAGDCARGTNLVSPNCDQRIARKGHVLSGNRGGSADSAPHKTF